MGGPKFLFQCYSAQMLHYLKCSSRLRLERRLRGARCSKKLEVVKVPEGTRRRAPNDMRGARQQSITAVAAKTDLQPNLAAAQGAKQPWRRGRAPLATAGLHHRMMWERQPRPPPAPEQQPTLTIHPCCGPPPRHGSERAGRNNARQVDLQSSMQCHVRAFCKLAAIRVSANPCVSNSESFTINPQSS